MSFSLSRLSFYVTGQELITVFNLRKDIMLAYKATSVKRRLQRHLNINKIHEFYYCLLPK